MSRPCFPLSLVVVLVAACQAGNGADGSRDITQAPADSKSAMTGSHAPAREYAGWYLQHAGAGRFQPCGSDAAWPIGVGADLADRARSFPLEDDTPLYVRVIGMRHDGVLDVVSVAQFGAPAPVRDCAMTGVVTAEGR